MTAPVELIGHWLGRLSGRPADISLTRTAWQVLNVVRDTTADAPAVGAVLADGWTTRPAPGRLALTPSARDRLAAFRELSMTGISLDEYRTAVSALERMTHNPEAR